VSSPVGDARNGDLSFWISEIDLGNGKSQPKFNSRHFVCFVVFVVPYWDETWTPFSSQLLFDFFLWGGGLFAFAVG
jgi:hypothetical protein